jgi:hypothetical protein
MISAEKNRLKKYNSKFGTKKEVLRFVGREHILSPSIVAELHSNVAVDNSTFVPICNLVPDFWW